MFWQSVIALSLLAAVFILWPLVHRLRSQHNPVASTHSDAQEQATSALGSDEQGDPQTGKQTMLMMLAIASIVPVFAILIYWQLGAKPDWEIAEIIEQRPLSAESKDALILALQNRVKQQPENRDIAYLLASSLLSVGRHEEAVNAYREVVKLNPESAQVLAEYAQALFLRAGNTITPAVREQTREALKRDPQSPTALGLAGIDAFQSGNYEMAIESWDMAMSQLNPQSPSYVVLQDGVERAKEALNNDGKLVVDKAKPELALDVKVTLNKELSNLKGATVFVYARAWQGPKMPLAIKRYGIADLPKSVRLSESMQMVKGMGLGSFPEVEVVARISQTGNAVPQEGDWTASVGPIVVAEQKKSIILKNFTQIQ